MSKKRRPRVALGLITRADGVRVEVKSPTVWKLLNEQAGRLEAQQQLLEALKGSLTKMEAERDHATKWVEALDAHWWIRLGVGLGIVRLFKLTPIAPGVEAIRKASVAGPPEPAPAT